MTPGLSPLFRASIVGASVALHGWLAFGYSPRRPVPAAPRMLTEVDLTVRARAARPVPEPTTAKVEQ
jgi:hypothetical protein